jgi:hypothetical protein
MGSAGQSYTVPANTVRWEDFMWMRHECCTWMLSFGGEVEDGGSSPTSRLAESGPDPRRLPAFIVRSCSVAEVNEKPVERHIADMT